MTGCSWVALHGHFLDFASALGVLPDKQSGGPGIRCPALYSNRTLKSNPTLNGKSDFPIDHHRRLTAGVKCVSHDLRRLPPRSVIIRPEVWQVAGRYAWLSHPAALIPSHDR